MPISGPFFLSLCFPKKIFDLSTGTFTTEHNITPNDRGWTAGRPIKTWKRPITPADCDRLRLPPETELCGLPVSCCVTFLFSFLFFYIFSFFFPPSQSLLSHFRLLFSWERGGGRGGKYGSRDDDDDFLPSSSFWRIGDGFWPRSIDWDVTFFFLKGWIRVFFEVFEILWLGNRVSAHRLTLRKVSPYFNISHIDISLTFHKLND